VESSFSRLEVIDAQILKNMSQSPTFSSLEDETPNTFNFQLAALEKNISAHGSGVVSSPSKEYSISSTKKPNRNSIELKLPAVLQSASDIKDDENAFKGSILGFSVKQLFSDFKEQAKKKIEKITSLPTEDAKEVRDITSQLLVVLSLENDSTFRNTVTSLGEMGKHCLTSLIKGMLSWRTNQLTMLESILASPAMKAKGRRVEVIEERFQVAVDYMFCSTVLLILNALSRDNLEETSGSQLENLAFEHLKPRLENKKIK